MTKEVREGGLSNGEAKTEVNKNQVEGSFSKRSVIVDLYCILINKVASQRQGIY